MLALECAATFRWDDPVTHVYGENWDGIEGALIPKSEGAEWWIVYNTRSNPERQRFTKAQEVGHYMLHRKKDALFRCGTDLVWERDSGKPDIEAQANQFASYLLMPANHVREKLHGQTITLDRLSQMARFYGVSLAAICLKFVEITDRRAVVMHWGNEWAASSTQCI